MPSARNHRLDEILDAQLTIRPTGVYAWAQGSVLLIGHCQASAGVVAWLLSLDQTTTARTMA